MTSENAHCTPQKKNSDSHHNFTSNECSRGQKWGAIYFLNCTQRKKTKNRLEFFHICFDFIQFESYFSLSFSSSCSLAVIPCILNHISSFRSFAFDFNFPKLAHWIWVSFYSCNGSYKEMNVTNRIIFSSLCSFHVFFFLIRFSDAIIIIIIIKESLPMPKSINIIFDFSVCVYESFFLV